MSAYETKVITVHDQRLPLAIHRNDGQGVPLLFLHGFGSTKEDYADISCHPGFEDRSSLAFDFPGFGASPWNDPRADMIEFYRDVTSRVMDFYRLDSVHVVGHSMGGLTGLALAAAQPERVASLTSIEGNLAPEDCFLSRRIFEYPKSEDDVFLERLADWLRSERGFGYALYASSLSHKVQWKAVRPVFKSIVEWSDGDDLLETFLGLPTSRMFMYGSSNTSLSYLPDLRDSDIRLAEIARSGHFPMYSNPVGMWDALGAFLSDQTS